VQRSAEQLGRVARDFAERITLPSDGLHRAHEHATRVRSGLDDVTAGSEAAGAAGDGNGDGRVVAPPRLI
jgi:hypothetical protein